MKRFLHWLISPERPTDHTMNAVKRIGAILPVLTAAIVAIAWIVSQAGSDNEAVPTTTAPTTVIEPPPSVVTSPVLTTPEQSTETTPAETNESSADSQPQATDAPVDVTSPPNDDTAESPPSSALNEPVVVLLQGDDGFFQRGFVTRRQGFIITPTQINLGDNVSASWEIGGDLLSGTAEFVRLGPENPEVSLFRIVDGASLPNASYPTQNASSVEVGADIEAWLGEVVRTPGTVTNSNAILQLPNLAAGSEMGLRLNDLGQTFVLCALNETSNVAEQQTCEGLSDTFNGQVITEFVGLEADQTEIERSLSAILAAEPGIDTIVSSNPTGATASARAAESLGTDPVIASTGRLDANLASAIETGVVDIYLPSELDAELLETTLITSSSDLGSPVRLSGSGPVVGISIAQSESDNRTYSLPIEVLRDNFPDLFG